MRTDTIHSVIPHADPAFLHLLERLPEPPTNSMEQVMKSLPRLHELFLQLRSASNQKDAQRFKDTLKQELAWLETIDQAAIKPAE